MKKDLRKVTKLVELQLVGLEGNAFNLMGAFRSASKQQKTPKDEIDAVINECMSGDYNHLLQTLLANTTSEEYENEEDNYDE